MRGRLQREASLFVGALRTYPGHIFQGGIYMNAAVQERIANWLSGPYEQSVKSEILRLQKENPQQLVDAFYRDLSFGTGGMRGIMGIGTNRMNVYTIRAATQGMANYLLSLPQDAPLRVFIGYDVRINSRLFAEETARVLAGNGIEALLTQDVCPSPLTSFGCRHYQCTAGIMITASHNPPQYNGYKVYWQDGALATAPHDEGIMAEVRKIKNPDQIRLAPLDDFRIIPIDRAIDRAYLDHLDRMRLDCSSPAALRIIYTNLHGTGIRLMPEALRRRGFSHVNLVQDQLSLDGHFPGAPSPNPEEEKALRLGIGQMLEEKADILLATDPDSDRLGCAVRHRDQAIRFNGNEIACLCFGHILDCLKQKNEIPPNAALIKTIVTTEMLKQMASAHKILSFDVLTGFKYIGELIREWEASFEGKQFLFGAEESHGYLFGTFVRDKDAIGAACLLAEAAAEAKKQNRTLVDRLHELYLLYGIHRQSLTNLAFEDSPSGMDKMETLMRRLRQSPPHSIHSKRIVVWDDYLQKKSTHTQSNAVSSIDLPASDVLRFWLEDGTKLVIRPSGTEPKIKIYAEVCSHSHASIETAISQCDRELKELIEAFKKENGI